MSTMLSMLASIMCPSMTLLLPLQVLFCRLARSRDEWESAMLQNANTKCNGLMPLWGPEVGCTCMSLEKPEVHVCMWNLIVCAVDCLPCRFPTPILQAHLPGMLFCRFLNSLSQCLVSCFQLHSSPIPRPSVDHTEDLEQD